MLVACILHLNMNWRNNKKHFRLSIFKNLETSKSVITLQKKLNRETEDFYIISVITRGGGSPPNQSILSVHIAVMDINDNSRVFSNNVYNISIKN